MNTHSDRDAELIELIGECEQLREENARLQGMLARAIEIIKVRFGDEYARELTQPGNPPT